ncbi:MAG: putative fatty-acid--CoA ligase [Myxococcales bacterium]|nr:putative fatty-acid--CoA ligase [Myxococcales bacterium]
MSVETLPALVRQAAAVHAGRPAVVDGEQRLDFAALAEAVMQAARAFLALGIARGDRVAIWAPNGWAWQVAALGAQSVGAVLVPLNTRWKGREAAEVLARSRARALVTVVDFLGVDYVARLRDCLARGAVDGDLALPDLRHIIAADGSGAGALDWRSFLDNGRAVSVADAETRARGVMPDDISDLIFTAGTTGQSKGVACTHGQTLRVFRTWAEIVGLRPRDRYLVVNPYFHTFGYKAGWLACLLTGATCLPHAVFDVATVLERVARERITVLPGPPTLYQSILDHPERGRFDLSSLRLAVTGAATIPVELIRRMRAELSFETILTAYGLTESCGVVTMCRPGDDLETIARTSGRPIPGVEVRIVDGEVRVRGYNVMRGYWNDPVATAAALDADGWLRTGDIGALDERGNLRITDRCKDMLIVGGFNVSPAEVEGMLVRHAGVAQAAVVGVPDLRLGEVPYAFVVLRPEAQVGSSALVAWARDEMANYKAPRHVEIVDALPMNAAGKVLKLELRKRAAAQLP